MGASTSMVIILLFIGFLVVAISVYSSVNYYQNLMQKAQNDQKTMKKAKMQTSITITNVSFSNNSGNVSLNITLQNTGKTTLNASLLDVFVNGTYYDPSYCVSTINIWVPENSTNLIFSHPAGMAIDNKTNTSINVATSINWSHTVGLGLLNSLLVVGVDIMISSSFVNVTRITYAGVNLTRANFSLENYNNQYVRAEIWYLTNPPAGVNNVNVTLNNATTSGEGAVAGAVSFSGVNMTNPIPTTATGNGRSANASTSITTANANSWIIDTVAVDNSNSITAASPQTVLWNNINPTGGSHSGGASTENTTTAGSYTMNWTLGGTQMWAQVAAEIKPAICNTPTNGRIKVVTENGISDYWQS